MTADRTVVDQAAEVIDCTWTFEPEPGENPSGTIADAIAAAGLLVDDLDRAVLDAAEAWAKHVVLAEMPGQRLTHSRALRAAIDARRAANGSET